MTIVYAFANTIRHEHPLDHICQVLHISRSCFYEWHNKNTHQPKAKDAMIEQKVIAVFREHKRRYGFRRVLAELEHQNVLVSPYKVRKYLCANGLKAIPAPILCT